MLPRAVPGVSPIEVHEPITCPRGECQRAVYRAGIGAQAVGNQWEMDWTYVALWKLEQSRARTSRTP